LEKSWERDIPLSDIRGGRKMVQGGGDRAADGARFRMKDIHMHSIENREITAFFDIFDFL
jgi:hypothetical protein